MGLIQLERLGESKDGYLSFFEAARHIPFEIKRIYYISVSYTHLTPADE